MVERWHQGSHPLSEILLEEGCSYMVRCSASKRVVPTHSLFKVYRRLIYWFVHFDGYRRYL
jgi:hypothetical protein